MLDCFKKRKRKELTELSPLEYSCFVKNEVKNKANKNKTKTILLFFIILFTTIFTPLLILVPYDDYLSGFTLVFVSKILPALLTSIGGISSGWLQLRKPQEKWIIYRTYQREIEKSIIDFTHNINGYTDDNKEKKIVETVSEKHKDLHSEWVKKAPKLEDILKLGKGESK